MELKLVATGNGAGVHPRARVSPLYSRIFFRNGEIVCGRFICVVVGGPRKCVDTACSGELPAIVSLLPRRCLRFRPFPTKELSVSAIKLLLLAGSKRLTRGVLSPGGRVPGACLAEMGNTLDRRSASTFLGNISVKRRGPAGPTILDVLSSKSVSRTRVAVARKGFRRVGEVFKSEKGRIVCLGQVGVGKLYLSRRLTLNRYHRLSRRRLELLGRNFWT